MSSTTVITKPVLIGFILFVSAIICVSIALYQLNNKISGLIETDIYTAHAYRIANGEGEIVAEIGQSSDGLPHLRFYDDHGNERFTADMNRDRAVGVVIHDSNQSIRMGLMVDDIDSAFYLFGAGESGSQSRISLFTEAGTIPGMAIHDEELNPRIQVGGARDDSTLIILENRDGSDSVYLGLSEEMDGPIRQRRGPETTTDQSVQGHEQEMTNGPV
jgi:hypothetical protein